MENEEFESREIKIFPAFNDNNIAIGMSCSNEYVPYLSVCLKSLVDNTSVDFNYDIIVFERSITEKNKLILKNFIEKKNVSLRFVDPTPLIKNYSLSYPSFYAIECFFRLASPIFLKEYDKIIFTDVDLVFQSDIKDLYQIDVLGKPLAACQDSTMGFLLNYPDADWFEYCTKTLNLEKPYEYFNTGVMVLNIREFNEKGYVEKLFSIADGSNFRILEQDILNAFFANGIKYIDESWNFPVTNKFYQPLLQYMPYLLKQKYDIVKKAPKIVHWAGSEKPWVFPEEEMAEIWWSYARQVPFYEVILKRMTEVNLPNNTAIIEDVVNYKKNRFAYWKYKLKSKITFGAKRQRYKVKRDTIKQKIRNAQSILNK